MISFSQGFQSIQTAVSIDFGALTTLAFIFQQMSSVDACLMANRRTLALYVAK